MCVSVQRETALRKIMYTYAFVYRYICISGCAEKSLARHTSQCRMTESIMSLERGVCSCGELQGFSCYRGRKEACQTNRAILTTSRSQVSSSNHFLQSKAPKEIHAILTETLGEHAPSYATVENCVAQFKRVVACCFPGRAKDLSATPRTRCTFICTSVCVQCLSSSICQSVGK